MIAQMNDSAVPVHTGSQEIYVKKRAPMKAAIDMPTLACFGAAIATIRIPAKITKKEMIIPAWGAVTSSEGAIAVSHASHTILDR